MHHPARDEPVYNQLATVYITDTSNGSKPEKLLSCAPWSRQESATADLSKGREYHITAAAFAPGLQGAFWIVVSGYTM